MDRLDAWMLCRILSRDEMLQRIPPIWTDSMTSFWHRIRGMVW